MKKLLVFVPMVLITVFVFAQKDSTTLQQIDEQVWYPFIQHYEAWDAAKFKSIHTDDMLRGGPWGLRTAEEYHGQNMKAWPERKAKGWTRDISFTFEHRVVGEDIAYEVGYYKVESVRDKGEKRTYYGQFHVVLHKVDGVWKIAQDWDADAINGRDIGEEDFHKNAKQGLYKD